MAKYKQQKKIDLQNLNIAPSPNPKHLTGSSA